MNSFAKYGADAMKISLKIEKSSRALACKAYTANTARALGLLPAKNPPGKWLIRWNYLILWVVTQRNRWRVWRGKPLIQFEFNPVTEFNYVIDDGATADDYRRIKEAGLTPAIGENEEARAELNTALQNRMPDPTTDESNCALNAYRDFLGVAAVEQPVPAQNDARHPADMSQLADLMPVRTAETELDRVIRTQVVPSLPKKDVTD